jgi:hypothetical protein
LATARRARRPRSLSAPFSSIRSRHTARDLDVCVSRRYGQAASANQHVPLTVCGDCRSIGREALGDAILAGGSELDGCRVFSSESALRVDTPTGARRWGECWGADGRREKILVCIK